MYINTHTNALSHSHNIIYTHFNTLMHIHNIIHTCTCTPPLTSYPAWLPTWLFFPDRPASAVQAAPPADAPAAGPRPTAAQGATETAWTTTKGA